MKSSNANATKTPLSARKSSGVLHGKKTPGSVSRRKTPSQVSASKLRNITPSRNHSFLASSKTPTGGDRYIPNRSATNFELGQYLHHSQSISLSESSDPSSSLSGKDAEYQRQLADALNAGIPAPGEAHQILAYKAHPPMPPLGFVNQQKVLYMPGKATPATSCRKTMRHIPSQPERILDAPEIVDDYYLNLIDWGQNGLLAVALSNQLYIWNAATGDIDHLCDIPDGSYFCSVAWGEGSYLALGSTQNTVQLWDVGTKTCLRTLNGHTERVGALSWNRHILSSGSRDAAIHNHDVRIQSHIVAKYNGHSQEVCGLKWSPNGQKLASGSNDNSVILWENVANGSRTPLMTITEHQAAVKALAWCPWQSNILATGAGTLDRTIKLWTIHNGACIESVDTQSQVSGLLWSTEYRELLSSHGHPNFDLSIWKYPTMTKVAELTGHTMRILNICMSPNEEMVISASADESLRIWKCFAVDPASKKKKQRSSQQKHPVGSTLPNLLR